jgi:hypothetical protein
MERWLRAYDCTVPGCKHEPNDRCPECIREKRKCDHNDGDRVRCNGSWNVDVKVAETPHEALKYSVSCDDGIDSHRNAEMAIAVYLWTYGRHRIETYGLAKPGAISIVDSVDKELEDSDRCCPDCSKPLVDIMVGEKRDGFYSWRHARQRE